MMECLLKPWVHFLVCVWGGGARHHLPVLNFFWEYDKLVKQIKLSYQSETNYNFILKVLRIKPRTLW